MGARAGRISRKTWRWVMTCCTLSSSSKRDSRQKRSCNQPFIERRGQEADEQVARQGIRGAMGRADEAKGALEKFKEFFNAVSGLETGELKLAGELTHVLANAGP